MQNDTSETGFFRLVQIIGKPATARSPAIPALIPISRSAWYAGILAGRFPKPIQIGPRTSVYRKAAILALVEQLGCGIAA